MEMSDMGESQSAYQGTTPTPIRSTAQRGATSRTNLNDPAHFGNHMETQDNRQNAGAEIFFNNQSSRLNMFNQEAALTNKTGNSALN